jgi:prepilin-type N-terminal cleavage/methylation domain-containing protein
MAPSVASPARRDLILNCRGKCLGFTLIELLVTVAVIASLALLALTAITSITGQADESANRRNAQNMASVAATARAAGFTNHIATPEEWAEALNNGIIVTNALGHVLGEFRVGGLSEERVTAAIQYLVVTNTHLVYSSATD